jgi:hypothetical protein
LTPASSSVASKKQTSFIYCDDKTTFEQFHDHVKSITEKLTIYLDCEGRDLGRITGALGLIQVGIEKKVYLIDVVSYPKCIAVMKDILEDPHIDKVMWDGRSDATELWCSHKIALGPVIDLQLIRVYLSQGGRPGPRGYMKLEGMGKVFEQSSLSVQSESSIDMRKFTKGHHPAHVTDCSEG